ncbi:hypothetical protein X566_22410 [Afipia sp. P52-10]|jgi:hypothetical protein|uniref:hypothetical protein n=1 Tax=Afipia sp. P52-10 TaxID=1429916 RepID=UPI0003DF0B38|nr:hypothetical protein [Afipia sp. P52-10]ETR75460.1 hypothetical protein X566_22410 [Afipia sp. P52-10]
MRELDIHACARELLEVRGVQAIADAAQNAVKFETEGNADQARTWRRIESALKIMRGPHQS